MPLVRSFDCADDLLTLVTTRGGTFTLARADIPANVINKPIDQVETFVNNWLATRLTPLGMTAAIHIYSLTPRLVWTGLVANGPIEGQWWP